MKKQSFGEQSVRIHKKMGGKIKISSLDSLDSPDKLSLYYTPGVASVSKKITKDPEALRTHTWVGNTVAVISDGSAVLGLGNIGPKGAMPVMEGKSMLFQQFAGINAVPIVLDTHSASGIIKAVQALAPSFGGINLEDIAAPLCFEVENRLKKILSIPVFHDDQHGTAVVVLAGLINAMKLKGLALHNAKIVIVGAGAAGTAIAKLLHAYAHPNLFIFDSKGLITTRRDDLNKAKKDLLNISSTEAKGGSLSEIIKGADVFIGVSQPGLLTQAMVRSMNPDPVIFAMANPTPEILPAKAKAAGANIIATGRSDFPNQINNALCFPGIFRGALDNAVHTITEAHKVAAAEALASLVHHPTPDYIIPSVLDDRTVPAIASVIT